MMKLKTLVLTGLATTAALSMGHSQVHADELDADIQADKSEETTDLNDVLGTGDIQSAATWIEDNFDNEPRPEAGGDVEGEEWIEDNFDNEPRPEVGGDVEGEEWIEENFDDTIHAEQVANDQQAEKNEEDGKNDTEEKDDNPDEKKSWEDLIDWNKVKDLLHKNKQEELGQKPAADQTQEKPEAKQLPQTGAVATVAPAALGLALAAVGAGFAFRKHD